MPDYRQSLLALMDATEDALEKALNRQALPDVVVDTHIVEIGWFPIVAFAVPLLALAVVLVVLSIRKRRKSSDPDSPTHP